MRAKYPGLCTICREPILQGQNIWRPGVASGTWAHTGCHPGTDVVSAIASDPPPTLAAGPQPSRKARPVKAGMVAPADAVSVYTDGACSGNPGPGGWAWAIDRDVWASGGEDPSTNQRMEIRAALEAVAAHDGPLVVVSDSTYVVNCFRDRWWAGWIQRGWLNSQKKPVANRELWEPLIHAVNDRGNVAFEWVKGHSGHEMNDFVDQLAVRASLGTG